VIERRRTNFKFNIEENILKEMFKFNLLQIKCNIERQILGRLLPEFSKSIDVRNQMIVGCYSKEEWDYIAEELKKEAPPVSETNKKFRIPDHYGTPIQSSKNFLHWELEQGFPALPSGSFWPYTKWATDKPNIWRGKVISFGLTWNSWNHAVKLSYKYDVEVYSFVEKIWLSQ